MESFSDDSTVKNVADALNGAAFERNVLVSNIASHAFMNAMEVINCAAQDIQVPAGQAYHPDVLILSGATYSNVIYYGITATQGITSQGLFANGAGFGTSLHDAAFVNIDINNQKTGISPVFQVFQFCCPCQNMLVLNSEFVGPSYWQAAPGFSAQDVVVEATTFSPRSPGPFAGVKFK